MNIQILLKKIKRLVKDDSKPIDDIHTYWEQPLDGTNTPKDYLVGEEKSTYLFNKIGALKENSILEIGCNVGRNLNYLYQKGFNSLSGIEISKNAIDEMKASYRTTYDKVLIHNTSVEDFFMSSNEDRYDLIFTMAVLEHIHTDSDWIFEKMVETTNRYIITIEDERSISWKHFPRNYKKKFEELGMTQVDFEDCSDVKGLHNGFYFRMFEKKGIMIKNSW